MVSLIWIQISWLNKSSWCQKFHMFSVHNKEIKIPYGTRMSLLLEYSVPNFKATLPCIYTELFFFVLKLQNTSVKNNCLINVDIYELNLLVEYLNFRFSIIGSQYFIWQKVFQCPYIPHWWFEFFRYYEIIHEILCVWVSWSKITLWIFFNQTI